MISIGIDKRRSIEFTKKADYNKCWNISLKYSNMLVKNINSRDLYTICCSVYGQYLTELKSKKLPIKNKNYIQVWDTMINTVKKGVLERQAIKLLHQTSYQHN